MPVFSIPEDPVIFPHPSQAEEDGLLGIGGDLSINRLLLAYQNGIFPWYAAGEAIHWWCLTPRLILYPEKIKVSKSMNSYLKSSRFQISFDKDFLSVMLQCKTAQRKGQNGSWIHKEIIEAFLDLHYHGLAHSVEVWQDSNLVGGLYGLSIGKMFCGESMFAITPNASKLALIHLASLLKKMDYHFIDCQQDTPHLRTMGAEIVEKDVFFRLLENNRDFPILSETWKTDFV